MDLVLHKSITSAECNTYLGIYQAASLVFVGRTHGTLLSNSQPCHLSSRIASFAVQLPFLFVLDILSCGIRIFIHTGAILLGKLRCATRNMDKLVWRYGRSYRHEYKQGERLAPLSEASPAFTLPDWSSEVFNF